MIDLFRILKLEYKKYVILFKCGSFYVSYDEDSIILNKLFDYKIVDLKNNIKVGFPLSNIDMVKEKLQELQVNYIIVEDKRIISEYKDDSNKFSEYTSSVFNIISVNNRIDKIVKRLKTIDSEKIDGILDKIESLVFV